MSNKMFIQDAQLNIAASVPTAVSMGVQNVDTSSPFVGQFGQMLSQIVGQYKANKQQIDYADMQFELSQLEKQWHLNNTADPNVYRTEESRGNLIKSYEELLQQRKDIVESYRGRIGDENFYNYSKELQSQVSQEMVGIQTGINQGFVEEEAVRSGMQINSVIQSLGDIRNPFNAEDGGKFSLDRFGLSTSKLNYIGIGDAETRLKYIDNYFSSAKTIFKNNLIDDIYKNFAPDGLVDVEGANSYVNMMRVSTMSDENISKLAEPLFKYNQDIFVTKQAAEEWVKHQIEGEFAEVSKFLSIKNVEKKRDEALLARQNARNNLVQANELMNKALRGEYDILDGTPEGSAIADELETSYSYSNNNSFDNIGSPEMLMSTMDVSLTQYAQVRGNNNAHFRATTNLYNAFRVLAQKYPDKYDPDMFSFNEYYGMATEVMDNVYGKGATIFDATTNPAKRELALQEQAKILKKMETKKEAYDKISNYKNDNIVQAMSIKMANSTRRKEDYDKAVSFFRAALSGQVTVTYKDSNGNVKTKIVPATEWFNEKFSIDFSKTVDRETFSNFVQSDSGKKAIALIVAGYDNEKRNNRELFNSEFYRRNRDNANDVSYIANSYLSLNMDRMSKADETAKNLSMASKNIGSYVYQYNSVVEEVQTNRNSPHKTFNPSKETRNKMTKGVIINNGGTTQGAFTNYMQNDVAETSEVYREMINSREAKGQDTQAWDGQSARPSETQTSGNVDISKKTLSKYKRNIDSKQSIRNSIYK